MWDVQHKFINFQFDFMARKFDKFLPNSDNFGPFVALLGKRVLLLTANLIVALLNN